MNPCMLFTPVSPSCLAFKEALNILIHQRSESMAACMFGLFPCDGTFSTSLLAVAHFWMHSKNVSPRLSPRSQILFI